VLSVRLTAVTDAAAKVKSPGPLIKYVKRVDGSIDVAATAHERNKLLYGDDPDFVCQCPICLKGEDLVLYEKKERDVNDPYQSESLGSLSKGGIRPTPITIEQDSPVVVKAAKDYKKKVERIGEAKNPGPGAPIFRGDQAQVHNCGRQLLFLQGKLPQKAVLVQPRVSARNATPKSVVPKARAQRPAAKQSSSRPIGGQHVARKAKVADFTKAVQRATLLHDSLSGKSCYACGKVGHFAADCKKAVGSNLSCFTCGRMGHKSFDCKSLPKNNPGAGRERRQRR